MTRAMGTGRMRPTGMPNGAPTFRSRADFWPNRYTRRTLLHTTADEICCVAAVLWKGHGALLEKCDRC